LNLFLGVLALPALLDAGGGNLVSMPSPGGENNIGDSVRNVARGRWIKSLDGNRREKKFFTRSGSDRGSSFALGLVPAVLEKSYRSLS
jgi:hypothetical protein